MKNNTNTTESEAAYSLSLRITPEMRGRINQVAKANGILFSSAAKMLLTHGINNLDTPHQETRVKKAA
jgi:antitoxin component of RelBE/YafQ-DinJ toxin-antitoxin module